MAGGLELEEPVDGSRELAVLRAVVEHARVGEVRAHLGTDADELAGMVVEAERQFSVVGVKPGPRSMLVAVVLGAKIHVHSAGRMSAEDVVQAPETRGADAGDVRVPAVVGLDDLVEVLAPTLL